MKRYLAILLCAPSLFLANAGMVTITNPPPAIGLAWRASPTPGVTNYNIYWGPGTRNYTNLVAAGNVLAYTLTNVARGLTYYVTATAQNTNGLQSGYCNEVVYTVPALPEPPDDFVRTNATITVKLERSPTPAGPWGNAGTLTTFVGPPGYWRSLLNIELAGAPTPMAQPPPIPSK